jgi:hypothetical protein
MNRIRRFLPVLALSALCGLGFADDDFAAILGAIKSDMPAVCDELAAILPLDASTGSIWSDSYIGNFPHLGVALSAGVIVSPKAGAALLTLLNDTGATGIDETITTLLRDYGLPFPSASVGARIGGFGLPFDVAVLYSGIPESLGLLDSVEGVDLSYSCFGLDFRYGLLDEKKNAIDLSLGAGLFYMSGKIGYTASGLLSEDTTSVPGHTLDFSDPVLALSWSTFSLDLSAQVSKKIVFFTPYAGLGLTFGLPTVEASYTAPLVYEDGSQVSVSQIVADGYTGSTEGLEDWVIKNSDGITTDLRAYGGFSLDLLILHFDFSAMYGFISQNYGGSLNLRLQF